jgi:predicted CoA-binding protein
LIYPKQTVFLESPNSSLNLESSVSAKNKKERAMMLDSLFNPKGVAVIGASGKELHIGNRVIKNLLDFGYKGGIYPINPKADQIRGIKAYKSILDVPGQVDVAHMVIPAKFVPMAVEDCGKKGVKHIIINSGGFSETGPAGADIERPFWKRPGHTASASSAPTARGSSIPTRCSRLLQLHLHLPRGRTHLHRGPVRRGGRGDPPGILRHGCGYPHLRVQWQRLRYLHPGDHPLPGR